MQEEVFIRYCEQADELGQRFLRLMHQELAGVLDTAVTGNQFVVLKIISNRGQATVSEVAEDLSVSLSAVTASVDRLCRAGLVERRRSEKDRRVVQLELTAQGKKVVTVCQESRMRVLQRYLGCLEETELLHMINIHEKLIAVLRQEDEKDWLNSGR
ncbi:MAG: MarR family transcriptional regulator [Firmicutes bacterium]|nr:MarR family transcriptional regulator [Bacillota bacterium]